MNRVACYNGMCEFVPVTFLGQLVAKVVHKDEKIEKLQDSNIYYLLSATNENHPYWIFVPEWNMYRSNVSCGRIQKGETYEIQSNHYLA